MTPYANQYDADLLIFNVLLNFCCCSIVGTLKSKQGKQAAAEEKSRVALVKEYKETFGLIELELRESAILPSDLQMHFDYYEEQ